MVTALTRTKRYIRPGIDKVYFIPTAANYKALTRTELDAGTDLTPELTPDGVAGFNTTSDLVDTPDWGSRFTSKVAGMITSDDSSLTLYASQDGEDARSLLPRDTTGFVVFLDGGDSAGNPMAVFPVTVSSMSPQRSGTDPASIQVGFAITDEPSEDQVVPAAAP